MTESRRTIVTFFEQYGAGAGYIAPRVAERLGVPFLQQRFSSEELEEAEAARQAAAHEEGGFGRFLRTLSFTGAHDADLARGDDAEADHDIVVDNTRTVMEAVADQGGVLLGRNATVILATVPGALHVRLTGSVESRVARAAQEGGVDPARAGRRQVYEDRVRAEMAQRLYQWDVNDDQRYDLIVNTGSFTPDQVVDLVVATYRVKWPR